MPNRTLHRALLITALFTHAPLARAADLHPPMRPPFSIWTDEGEARACIVAASGPGDRPAQELNGWIKRITKVALPIATSAPDQGPRVFVGGAAAWNRLNTRRDSLGLGTDGFVIRAVGRDLVIAGGTDLGTLFGVYAFLEHYLDCRWFWPGENGIYCPSRPTLRVGQIDEVSLPDFRIRWIIRTADCARFNRLNVGIRHPDEFRIKWFVHTWLALVPPKAYWPGEPEYYAEVGGKRKDPSTPRSQVNICTTNPAVASAAAKMIDEIMRGDPAVDMVSVDPMDTQVFCGCTDCQKLYDTKAPYELRASRLVFDFSNRLAELDQCLGAAEQAVEGSRASARVGLMRRNWQYCTLVYEYLSAVGRELAASAQARWYGSAPRARVREAVQRVQPLADRVKAFILDKANAGAVHGFGGYEQLLVSPQSVAAHWQYAGDRDRRDVVIDKTQWLREHPQNRLAIPPTFALWIYGNDLDWMLETGPEHVVYLRSGDAPRSEVGRMGRPDRRGDGVNLCFVLRNIGPDLLAPDSAEVSIDNPAGGPFASRIFAVYVMPDDDTGDNDAQRLIETDIDRVRRRAIGFAEFGHNGRWSNEGVPFAQAIRLHCLKTERE